MDKDNKNHPYRGSLTIEVQRIVDAYLHDQIDIYQAMDLFGLFVDDPAKQIWIFERLRALKSQASF